MAINMIKFGSTINYLLLFLGIVIIIYTALFTFVNSKTERHIIFQHLDPTAHHIHNTPDDLHTEHVTEGNQSQKLNKTIQDRNGNPRLCSMAQRAQILENTCAKLNRSSSYLPPREHLEHLIVDDRHKLIYCGPAKCGSSTWLALLERASGRKRKKNKVGVVHANNVMIKNGLRRLIRYNDTEIEKILKNYYKFIVIRHPFERLVSAWRDKFIQPNGPYQGWGRKIASQYKKDRNELKSIKQGDPYWETRAYFVEFARRLAEKPSSDPHWIRYEWFCHPCDIKWDAVVRVETSNFDSPIIFEKLGDDLQQDELPVMHTHQNRSDINHFQMQLPQMADIRPDVLKTLYRIYGRDMDMFGYEWDQDNLMASCGKDTCC